jgi:hypothetical protein
MLYPNPTLDQAAAQPLCHETLAAHAAAAGGAAVAAAAGAVSRAVC